MQSATIQWWQCDSTMAKHERTMVSLQYHHTVTILLSSLYWCTVIVVLSRFTIGLLYCHYHAVVWAPSYCHHYSVVLSPSYCLIKEASIKWGLIALSTFSVMFILCTCLTGKWRCDGDSTTIRWWQYDGYSMTVWLGQYGSTFDYNHRNVTLRHHIVVVSLCRVSQFSFSEE
jgi:hypothetical protein